MTRLFPSLLSLFCSVCLPLPSLYQPCRTCTVPWRRHTHSAFHHLHPCNSPFPSTRITSPGKPSLTSCIREWMLSSEFSQHLWTYFFLVNKTFAIVNGVTHPKIGNREAKTDSEMSSNLVWDMKCLFGRVFKVSLTGSPRWISKVYPKVVTIKGYYI